MQKELASQQKANAATNKDTAVKNKPASRRLDLDSMKSNFLRKRKPAARESPLHSSFSNNSSNSNASNDDDDDGNGAPDAPSLEASSSTDDVGGRSHDEGHGSVPRINLVPAQREENSNTLKPRGPLKKAPSFTSLPLKSPRGGAREGKSLSPPPGSDKELLPPKSPRR
jgi:hypothetical protein